MTLCRRRKNSMSRLSDFLIIDYASRFGVTWNSATMSLRTECPASIRFELEDKKPTIIQPTGNGVSVIRRKPEAVEVVDLEEFTKLIHGRDNTPSSCDFVISPFVGEDFLLLNELTRSKSSVILPFRQPESGLEQQGKLEKARQQLTATILRFYEVSDFCDQYVDKTALFSCRLTDKVKKGLMAKSAKAFNSGIYKLQRIRLHESLPHGFVFKMMVYNEEYKIV